MVRETKNDETLVKLRQVIEQGWPKEKSEVQNEIREYWDYREEMHVAEDLIFKGGRLVIRSSLRHEMLKKVHEGHQGMERCKMKARELLFWPRMMLQIEDMISRCSVCLTHRKANVREPLKPHNVPDRTWQTVGTDLLYFQNKTYLLIVYYYLKYTEITQLKETSSAGVINAIKKVFATHDIQDKVVSDNGPQYASRAFKEFARNWQFDHATSGPTYAQSNGMPERAVHTVKKMYKALQDRKYPYLCL